MRSLGFVVLAALAAFPIFGCGEAPLPKNDPPPAPALSETASANANRRKSTDEKAPDVFEVKFTTTKGDFVVEVRRDWAPRGADRFYTLVKSGYYDGNKFFRVVPDFVVQFGISGDPAKNQEWDKTEIADDEVKETNARGNLVFATSGPHTRTTQLFINLKDNKRLDSMGFSPFGKVTSGMDVVDSITAQYGEQADQQRITHEGNAYLEKNFPEMDGITKAEIVSPAAAGQPTAQ